MHGMTKKWPKLPVGKGAYDLAQPAFMTSKSSEITTEPSAAMPQYSLTPPSEPCNHSIMNFCENSLYTLPFEIIYCIFKT